MAFLQSGGSLVTSASIVDDSIVNADVNSAAAIDLTKLAGSDASGYNVNILNPAGITYKTVTVSSADILAMSTVAGPEIVAAPGANKAVVILHATLTKDYNTVAYVNGFTTSFYYNGTSVNALGSTISTTFVTSAADAVYICPASSNVDITTAVNTSVIWRMASGSQFITGNSVVKVHVVYKIVSIV